MKIESKTFSELEEMQEDGPIHGVFKVLDDDYHKFKAVSSTAIKAASVSMAHFNAKYDPNTTELKKEKPVHFVFGSAFHAYMLDMPEFNRSFAIRPNLDLRTKEGRAWKEENKYKHILSTDDMYLISEMAKKVHKSKWWRHFTKGPYMTEIAMFWKCGYSGLQCKSKVDLLNKDVGILDLKTTTKPVTGRDLYYAYKNFKYALQEAHYINGLRACLPDCATTFALGFVEKAEPFETRGSILKNTTRENIEREYEGLMIDIAYAIQNEDFPGPSVGDDLFLEVEL